MQNFSVGVRKLARYGEGLELSHKDEFLEHLYKRGLIKTQTSGRKYIYSFPSLCHKMCFSHHSILPHIQQI